MHALDSFRDMYPFEQGLWSVVCISLCAKANVQRYTEMVSTIKTFRTQRD